MYIPYDFVSIWIIWPAEYRERICAILIRKQNITFTFDHTWESLWEETLSMNKSSVGIMSMTYRFLQLNSHTQSNTMSLHKETNHTQVCHQVIVYLRM